MRLHTAAAMILALVGATACDDGATAPSVPDAVADQVAPSSALTPWSPGTGTSSVPTYDKSCRFGADTVFESPSNGVADDAITLTATSSDAELSVTVTDGSGQVLAGTATLDRGLADKSWRNATGSATWSDGLNGEVVDGAICFSERLEAGQAAIGEFSLVMQADDGSYHSVSGGFSLAADAIKPASGETVLAPTVDVDLR